MFCPFFSLELRYQGSGFVSSEQRQVNENGWPVNDGLTRQSRKQKQKHCQKLTEDS